MGKDTFEDLASHLAGTITCRMAESETPRSLPGREGSAVPSIAPESRAARGRADWVKLQSWAMVRAPTLRPLDAVSIALNLFVAGLLWRRRPKR